MLWWCNMKKIVLFSNCKEIFETTSKVVDPKHKLIWCSFTSLEENKYPCSAIVIIHFDHNRLKEDTFKFIIKVKGRLGHKTPILALIEGGTAQDIFSILKAGVYDYLVTTENLQEYKKKIDDIVLWDWYLKKYDD